MTGRPAARDERAWAVPVARGLFALLAAPASLVRRLRASATRRPAWPPLPGSYVVGDGTALVAVCTLSDGELMRKAAALPGVAIAGRVYTANLGIERIVLNLTANPCVRFLLLCGKDSPLFHAGQSLVALGAHGLTPERRIVGAVGHVPVLGRAAARRVEHFRRQIEVVDRIGETDVAALGAAVRALTERRPAPVAAAAPSASAPLPTFQTLQPGGRREALARDPNGFFVVTIDRVRSEILVQHYRADHAPGHEMRGRSAEAMLLGLLRADLITQLSHAGYLGAELAKAETALRLGLAYEQDRPLRPDRD